MDGGGETDYLPQQGRQINESDVVAGLNWGTANLVKVAAFVSAG